LLSLIFPWHCSHRGTETGTACLSCHLKLQTYLRVFVPGVPICPAPKMRTSADSCETEGASLQSCLSASSSHCTARTDAQRLGLLACLATSNFKRRLEMGGSLSGSFPCPGPKMRTSADSWQPERASLESCCSASSAQGTARTEAQRLGLRASLATSNFTRSLPGPCRAPPAALLQKCERLQVGSSQKGLAREDVAQPHLHMALLAQRHRDWGCLLVSSPHTSNVALEWGASLPGFFPCSGPKM